MGLSPAMYNEILNRKFDYENSGRNTYIDCDIFSYLEDVSICTPLWIDVPRLRFYLDVINIIKSVDIDNITTEDVFFYSQLNDEDICPKDEEALRKYGDENCLNIKKNIILSIVSYMGALCNEFVVDGKRYNDLGLSVPLMMEVRDKIVELSKCNIPFSKNDLYLKLCTLRDSLKLANKRHSHLQPENIACRNIIPFGCVINIDEVTEGMLKYVPFYNSKKYKLEKEEDLKELFLLCHKDNLKISLLIFECLLLLIDPTKSTRNQKLMNKISRFCGDGYYYSGALPDKLDKSNANSWISSIPSVEPNSVIQVTKVKKFKNIKNVVNRGDIFNKKMPTFRHLTDIFEALSPTAN